MSSASDTTIEYLKMLGGPITRARYISFIHFGMPPDELSAEEEAEIPDYPWDAADESLTDFDPDEPRDETGKWAKVAATASRLAHEVPGAEYLKAAYRRLVAEQAAEAAAPDPKPPPGWHDGLKLYHGTAMRAANDIMAHGIIAHQGEGGDAWAARNGMSYAKASMKGGRAVSVYMTPDMEFAKKFAKIAAMGTKSQPVMFEVDLPPDQATKLKRDEYSADAFRYEGNIPPSWIHIVPIKEWGRIHDAAPPTKIYMVMFVDGEED